MHTGSPLSIVSLQLCTCTEPPSSIERTGSAHLSFEEEVGMNSGNLSSTLQKLHLWEKKLHNEVKVHLALANLTHTVRYGVAC